MTEAVISKVKRPVLWDLQIKDYHNRNFVDKEWRNLSQTLKISSKRFYIAYVFSLCTKICTGVQNLVHVIK
jgi:heterodisulfide reductase subunit C